MVLLGAVLAAVPAGPATAALVSVKLQLLPGDAGEPSDIPLIGDWDGDGVGTVAIVRPRTTQVAFKNSNEDAAPTFTRVEGDPGDVPVPGRWNAQLDGDVIALHRGQPTKLLYYPGDGTGQLNRNTAIETAPDLEIQSGDWDGDGVDSPGLWSPAERTLYVTDSTASPVFRIQDQGAGEAGDRPVIGDWDGDGRDTLALYREVPNGAGRFYRTVPGQADVLPVYLGDPGDLPVAGDFDGDGDDTPGVYRPSTQTFYLELGGKASPTPTPTAAPTPTPTAAPTPTPTAAPTPTPTSTPADDPTPVAPRFPNPIPPIAVAFPNGTGGQPRTAMFAAAATPKRVFGTFGRPLAVKGKLVDAGGTPISGAKVDVFERVAVSGSPNEKVYTLTTGPAGAFVYAPRGANNRTIEFAYASTVGSSDYLSTMRVEVRVKPAITFTSNRRAAPLGAKVSYTGVVKILGLPKGGARVVLEASSGAGWKLAKIVRTTASGAFSWTHAFKTRGRYRVRARMLGSPGLPARPAASEALPLRVR